MRKIKSTTTLFTISSQSTIRQTTVTDAQKCSTSQDKAFKNAEINYYIVQNIFTANAKVNCLKTCLRQFRHVRFACLNLNSVNIPLILVFYGKQYDSMYNN